MFFTFPPTAVRLRWMGHPIFFRRSFFDDLLSLVFIPNPFIP